MNSFISRKELAVKLNVSVRYLYSLIDKKRNEYRIEKRKLITPQSQDRLLKDFFEKLE